MILRIPFKEPTRDGTSASTSRCSGSSHSAWITTGPVGHKAPRMLWVTFVLPEQFKDRQAAPHNFSEKRRQSAAHPESMYSYMNYIAYVLYPLLYIAGHIMTFNDFVWQVSVLLSYLSVSLSKRDVGWGLAATTSNAHIITFNDEVSPPLCHLLYDDGVHPPLYAIKDRKAWVGATRLAPRRSV